MITELHEKQDVDTDLQHILNQCSKNDRKGQQELYKLFYSYGMSIGVRYVQSESEAVEILNDSFMKVFSNIKKYDSSQPFKPWFRKIVVNTALNHMKKNHKLKLQTELDDRVQPSAREEILSKIGYQELLNLVQSLSAAYRTVFNMYVIDGYKHEEISNQLGITVGTSKSNLSKARAILQQRIINQLEITNA